MELQAASKYIFRQLLSLVGLTLLGLSLPVKSLAQNVPADSVFSQERLGYEDIVERKPEKDQKIFGASRFAEDPDDLPVRTYIITQEQIQQNGYATLVDVLKHIPGFRTSQPGDALLGETFLMRGLVGNLYTKITINGVPIDPSAAKGLPLGAQLPIRQAERIEVILGPASMLYGADALAGVINIVLPEVERPVEVMGSVGLGNSGTTEMHLSLGGKMGRDKNILRYRIFGSSKVMTDWNLNYGAGDTLMQVDTAVTNSSPFYSDSTNIPTINELPHESRLIGVNLAFRGFTLTTASMSRSDHSAIGAHPEDVSYAFFNGQLTETILSNRLRYEHDFGRLSVRTNASVVSLRMDPNSQYLGVAHPISADLNHVYAESIDFTLEQLAFYKVSPELNLLAGAVLRRETGKAFQGYLNRPYSPGAERFDSIANFDVIQNASDPNSAIGDLGIFNTYSSNELGGYMQANYNTKKLHLSAGGRLDYTAAETFEFSPKLGVNFLLTDKIHLRGFYAKAYRMPSTYNTFNNYKQVAFPGTPTMPPRLEFIRTRVPLDPERLVNIEGGITFDILPSLRAEIHYFRHRLNNSIFSERQFFARGGADVDDGPPPPMSGIDSSNVFGFSNRNSVSHLNGFQGFVTYDANFVKFDLSGQISIGTEAIEGLDTIDDYRSVPKTMGQANVHFRFGKNIRLSVYNQIFGEFNWAVIKLNNEISKKETGGYFNMDAVISANFTSRFMGYFRMTNVLNTPGKGIYTHDTSGQQFTYVLQQNRMFILGLTYQLQ